MVAEVEKRRFLYKRVEIKQTGSTILKSKIEHKNGKPSDMKW
jgi:hypothetical protein